MRQTDEDPCPTITFCTGLRAASAPRRKTWRTTCVSTSSAAAWTDCVCFSGRPSREWKLRVPYLRLNSAILRDMDYTTMQTSRMASNFTATWEDGLADWRICRIVLRSVAATHL